MKAAGPWREDMENAPRDTELLLQCRGAGLFETVAFFDWAKTWGFVVVAWAEINQPETTNANDIDTK